MTKPNAMQFSARIALKKTLSVFHRSPPQPAAEPTKITSEAVREITSEMSARIEDNKDTQFLFWSVLLGFAGFLAVICIQSKYSQPSAENLPG